MARDSLHVILVFALLTLTGNLALHAEPAPKKKPKVKPPVVKKAEPILSEKQPRKAQTGFSFNTAKEGTVLEFARGESFADRRERFLTMILKKYNKQGAGNLSPEEETKFLQDFNARQMLFVQKYDLNRNDILGEKDSRMLSGSIYERRLNFFRSFDANNDGKLDIGETARMRKEFEKRRSYFEDNFDRF